MLIGDGKPYLTALVVPEFEAVKEFAKHAHLSFNGQDNLVQQPEVYKLLEGEFAKPQKDLSTYERVRKFTILTSPLTVEGGEITPTMKVKRKVVAEKYKQLIEKMYEGAG